MGILDSIGGAVHSAAQWAGDRVDDAVQTGKDVADGVSGAVDDAAGWVQDKTEQAGQAISGAADWIGDKAGQTANDIGDVAREVGNAVSEGRRWIGTRVDEADQLEQSIGNAIDGAVTTAEKGVDGFRKDIVQFGKDHGGVVGQAVAQTVSDNIGLTEGAVLAVYDMGKGVVQLADGLGKLNNPLEWIAHPDRNVGRLETVAKVGIALGNLNNPGAWILDTQSNVNTVEGLWNGVTAGYQEAAKDGDYSKFAGRAVVDIGSFFIGAGEANAAIKGTEAAARLARWPMRRAVLARSPMRPTPWPRRVRWAGRVRPSTARTGLRKVQGPWTTAPTQRAQSWARWRRAQVGLR